MLIFTMLRSRQLIRRLFEAGARGYLPKSEARRFLIAVVASLSRHEPFVPDGLPWDLPDERLAKAGRQPD